MATYWTRLCVDLFQTGPREGMPQPRQPTLCFCDTFSCFVRSCVQIAETTHEIIVLSFFVGLNLSRRRYEVNTHSPWSPEGPSIPSGREFRDHRRWNRGAPVCIHMPCARSERAERPAALPERCFMWSLRSRGRVIMSHCTLSPSPPVVSDVRPGL